MLTRIKELAYDTVSKKFQARDTTGKKIVVPLGKTFSDDVENTFVAGTDSTGPQPAGTVNRLVEYLYVAKNFAEIYTDGLGNKFIKVKTPGLYRAYFMTKATASNGASAWWNIITPFNTSDGRIDGPPINIVGVYNYLNTVLSTTEPNILIQLSVESIGGTPTFDTAEFGLTRLD